VIAAIRGTERYGISRSVGSLGLDIGCLDHLGPLRDIVGDELSQFGRRHRHRRPAEFDETCLKLGIGEARIDLPVQRGDDLGRRVPGRTDAVR
jgi:hypothetical protein